MKVAIIHFVLLYMSGAERVLEALCELYPDADIFTHVYDPENIPAHIRKHTIKTTFINRMPGAAKLYKLYLPFMPFALEQLDLSGYDLVISCESGPTKGIIPDPDATHVCYCHTPMRYIWDMYHDYVERKNPVVRFFAAIFTHSLRIWDVTTSARVDQFIANSHFVARRIKRYYHRNSIVIPPPVNTTSFTVAEEDEDYYLWLGRLVHYKRPDIAVKAFNQNGRRLIMIGAGAEYEKLRRSANPNIELLGYQPFEVIKTKLSRCRALIFPGIEDAGIIPVEAMAAGRPVIAFDKGGVESTIIDGMNGVMFQEQTPEGLNLAIERFEKMEDKFDAEKISAHAAQFDKSIFMRSFDEAATRVINERKQP